ncbi:MAG TPA: hypothetical protein PLY91_09140 [Methanoregulaceae archaeon]|nr:hypothetical protein [Methanoregulaceae archaeon]
MARRLLQAVVVVLVVALIGAAGAVELWSQYYWYHPIGIISRLTLLAVVAALFVAVHMLTGERPSASGGDRP